MTLAKSFYPLVLAGANLAWPAFASDTDPQTPAVETITVIANKSDRAIAQVPATVTVISREQLERELTRDVKDMVRYEPGVNVSRDPQRFGLGSFNIRGVEGNRVALELDGVPVPQSFSVGSFASATRDWVDPDTLKRVEILRGPSSTLYGSSALGGVVTYTTRDPADLIGEQPGNAGFWSKAAGNSVDNSSLISAAAAARHDRWAGMLLASQRQGSEVRNNADQARYEANPADTDGTNLLGKIQYAAGPGNQLGLTVESSDSASDTNILSLVGTPGRYAATVAMRGKDSYQRRRISLDQDREVGSAYLDRLRWNAYAQASDTLQETWQQQDPAGRVSYPTLRYRSFDLQEDARGAEFILESSFETGKNQHRLVYGAEWVESRLEELRDGLQTNLDTGDTTNVIIGEVLPVRDFPISRSRQLGLFVQDEITLADGRIAVIPGLRYEHFSMTADQDPMFEADNPGVDPVSMDETSISPRLGMTAALGADTTVFVQYAEGFRAPPAEDLNIGFTIPAFNFAALPNPDLKPETSRGIETGLRFRGEFVRLDLSAYHNKYTNLIESRADQGVDPDSGVRIFQSVNRASATINGAELRVSLAGEALNQALDGWQVEMSLAYARGTDTERDQPLNTVSPLTGVLGLAYQAPGAPWGARLTGTLVAAQDRVDNSAGELFQPPGFGLMDLTAYYRVTPRLRLQAGVFNLGGKKYWEWGSTRGLALDDPATDFYTAPGRNASLSVIYSLAN